MRSSLGIHCKPHLHHQYIEQERVLLFADELIVQPMLPMINPGSLTMGFARVDPHPYGGLVILAHPRLMVLGVNLYITTLPEVSDPSSS